MYIWNYFKVKNYFKKSSYPRLLNQWVPRPPGGKLKVLGNHCSHLMPRRHGFLMAWDGQEQSPAGFKAWASQSQKQVWLPPLSWAGGLTDQERGNRKGRWDWRLARRSFSTHGEIPGEPVCKGQRMLPKGWDLRKGERLLASILKNKQTTFLLERQCNIVIRSWSFRSRES